MNEKLLKENLIVKLTFEFALNIIRYVEVLEEKRKYVIANQLLKSGTSIGANIWEAQNVESKADFIHKVKIGAKEADETHFWLLLCRYTDSYPNCDELLESLESIHKITNKIISTSKIKID